MDDKALDVACAQVGVLGGAFYFEADTLEIADQHGLDGFEFYFIGRGGVLGDVEPAVVASAFGYFNPTLVDQMWRAASAKIAPRAGARLYGSACQAFGRAKLADVPALSALCTAMHDVVAAADPRGLPFFAAHAAEPLPDDPPGRTMQLLQVLRELRGACHLLAVRASRLDPKVAHYLRRPDDMELFGWDPEEPVLVTAEDEMALQRADELTDRLVAPAYGVLDAAATSTLLDGLAAVEAAL